MYLQNTSVLCVSFVSAQNIPVTNSDPQAPCINKPKHLFARLFISPFVVSLLLFGHLQECLNGEFVRVGPNPKFVPVAGYHWYDSYL